MVEPKKEFAMGNMQPLYAPEMPVLSSHELPRMERVRKSKDRPGRPRR